MILMLFFLLLLLVVLFCRIYSYGIMYKFDVAINVLTEEQ